MNVRAISIKSIAYAQLTSALLILLMIGCVPATNPNGTVSDDTISLQADLEDGCTGTALTNLPFANSGLGANGLTPSTAYKICTAEQFNQIGTNTAYWSRYFVIKSNLNFVNISHATYNQIGVDGGTPFTGQIDGKGFLIVNFTMLNVGNQGGLISYLGGGGVLKNIKFLNGHVTGTDDIGILVGKNHGGTISNVDITITNLLGVSNVGGIVGYNLSGKITSSTVTLSCNTCPISTTGNNIGGAVGLFDSGIMSGVTVKGRSIAGLDAVGGLVGRNVNGFVSQGTVELSQSVSGTNNIGGAVGQNEGNIYGANITIKNVSTSSGTKVGGLVGFNSGGTIEASSATISGNISGLTQIAGLVGHNSLGALINLQGTIYSVTGAATGNYIGGGVGENTGSIEGMTIKVTKDVSCSTGTAVGGLVGYNQGDITSSTAQADNVKGGNNIGGLIGQNLNADITSSSASIVTAVVGTGSKTGGLIGDNDNSTITNCSATTPSVQGVNRVAGLVAYMDTSTITGSSAHISTSITGTSYIGGLVGQSLESQINSSSASVKAITGTADYVGGFIGHADIGSITNCYANTENAVKGINNIGGFAGYVRDTTILYTYSNSTTVEGTEKVGGHTGEAIATYDGYGLGVGSGYQISNNFALGDVVGNDASCLAVLPNIGAFIGNFEFTEDPFRTRYVMSDNYTNDGALCTNSGDCAICNNDYIESDLDADRIEFLAEHIVDTNPVECDTADEFAECECTPTTGTTCLEIEEAYFMIDTSVPLSNWNFGTFWKDGYGTLPTLK